MSFYTASWDYEKVLQAGAKRIDLDGTEVGTVTMQDQIEAQKRVQAEKQLLREGRKAQGPVEVVRQWHDHNRSVEQDFSTTYREKTDAQSQDTRIPTDERRRSDRAARAVEQYRQCTFKHRGRELAVGCCRPALKVFVGKATKLITKLEEKDHG